MFTKQTISEIAAVAHANALDPAALLAVADVESAGTAYAEVEGRREPLIRFEGHYFDLRLAGAVREKARLAGLAHPKPGKVANPLTQAGRWRLLNRAMQIDPAAACESTSWGLGQVMGAHWKLLGFSSVDELVHEARSGAAGQARLMAGYMIANGLDRVLARRDWRAFARAYNGPAYEKNGYHIKLEQAWRSYRSSIGGAAHEALLRFGSSGPEVSALQTKLAAHGHSLVVDGLFGRATLRALKDFQKRSGLIADGVAGPATQRALGNVGVEPKSASRPASSLRKFIWRAD